MGNLQYSILRYAPSLVSGETINLGAIFYNVEAGIQEFFTIKNWRRVSTFDDELNIKMMRALMSDITKKVGTHLDNPNFDLVKFCRQYDSEIYFDVCEVLVDIPLQDIDTQIELVKKMYFQFEYETKDRPARDVQKSFLLRLLKGKHVEYTRDTTEHGRHNAEIKFDVIFGDYGVVFFNFNKANSNHNTMNKVKAWAWNVQNMNTPRKLIVLYAQENSDETLPALNILKDVADGMFNIQDGFTDILKLIESTAS